ncbi:MAG TPA: aminoglycoside phosphotransferase family protein [Pyrinomonadaceae bacterium]|jgi:streptomycin 6-kinase|nr:aminoglycoside phosphotransferase family protein [Pyrinomonadaceae bacterium]
MQERNTFDLPQKFTRTITGMFGESGKKWLAELPEIARETAAKWSLKMEKPFKDLSYHFVAPCVCPDGSKAVLKIGFPGEELEFFNEVKTLQLYNGDGAVRLLDADQTRYAMLLEKLTPGESLGKLCLRDDARAVKIAAGILKKLVREIPEDGEYHLLENWINGFHRAENTAFPAEKIKKARDFYNELTGKKTRRYLLHGDFHHENILSAEREPYLVIDPKGLVGNVGYDAGVFLNNHVNWLEGMPDDHAKLDFAVRQFSEILQIAEDELRKWAFVQMILSAWWTFEENDERWRADLSKAEVWRV